MHLKIFEICILKQMKLTLLAVFDWYLYINNGRKCIRGGICHVIQLITNTWKIMIKIKNHRILSIRISIVCIDGQCRKSYLWLVLSGLKNHLISNEDFIKNHTPDSDIRYLLAADVQYPEEPQAYHNYYPF